MEAQHEVIYNWLRQEFDQIFGTVDPTIGSEIDGKLWKIAADWAQKDFKTGINAAIERLDKEAKKEGQKPDVAIELGMYRTVLETLLFTPEEWEQWVVARS